MYKCHISISTYKRNRPKRARMKFKTYKPKIATYKMSSTANLAFSFYIYNINYFFFLRRRYIKPIWWKHLTARELAWHGDRQKNINCIKNILKKKSSSLRRKRELPCNWAGWNSSSLLQRFKLMTCFIYKNLAYSMWCRW